MGDSTAAEGRRGGVVILGRPGFVQKMKLTVCPLPDRRKGRTPAHSLLATRGEYPSGGWAMKKVQPALYAKEFKKLGEDCKKWAETAPTEAERKDFLAVAKSCESHSAADGGRSSTKQPH
jgi:hypothetical protein